MVPKWATQSTQWASPETIQPARYQSTTAKIAKDRQGAGQAFPDDSPDAGVVELAEGPGKG